MLFKMSIFPAQPLVGWQILSTAFVAAGMLGDIVF